MDYSDDESDGSTATNICIGDRVYTVTITDDLIRNRKVEAAQVAKKAIVKKVNEDFLVTFGNREIQVPNNGKQLSRVVEQAYKDQDLLRPIEDREITCCDHLTMFATSGIQPSNKDRPQQ